MYSFNQDQSKPKKILEATDINETLKKSKENGITLWCPSTKERVEEWRETGSLKRRFYIIHEEVGVTRRQVREKKEKKEGECEI